MSQRDLHDYTRSAIVTVFLRLIENYQGLLFMTTNRHEDFDEAFYNRIRVSIRYPKLSSESRAQIWRNLMELKKDVMHLDDTWIDAPYNVLGDLDCNGREIRNLIRKAYGYAKFRGKHFALHQLLVVLRENSEIKNVHEILVKLEHHAERKESIPLAGLPAKILGHGHGNETVTENAGRT